MGDTLFTTSLAGAEVARLRTWGTGENRIGDYLQGSHGLRGPIRA